MPISPVDSNRKVFPTACGMRATMPANIIREIPFPIPRSVICSPSHIINAVPAVSVITVMILNSHPGLITMGAPPGEVMLSSPTLIPNPCMMLRTTVPYRVYWVIFFLPCSPSFDNRSRCGITTVNNCKIIEALIYGMIPNAKTESLSSAPPENISKRPKIVPFARAKKDARATASIPGAGT